jgi:hypothetical protein
MFNPVLRRLVLPTILSVALVGCANVPTDNPLTKEHAAAIRPVDLQIGIKQPEIYAAFEPSTGGAVAAATCGAIPGIGILLAAACGGAAGAIDASVNAARAKTADEQVRPVKDAVLDQNFDQLFSQAISKSLVDSPKLQFAGTNLTKTVDPKSYEKIFRASTANSVMFVDVDYRLSVDFSTLEVFVRGTVIPRSPAARTAAGLPPELPAPDPKTALNLNGAVYQFNLTYLGKLPIQAPSSEGYIAAWKANNGELLKLAMKDSATQAGFLLAEDIQREPNSKRTVLGQADTGRGFKGELLAERNGGQLIRLPQGALVYKTTLPKGSASAQVTSPDSSRTASVHANALP